jgi:hypothetical protein
MSVTSNPKPRTLIALAAGAVLLVAAAVIVTLALTRPSGADPTKPDVQKIANIARPNAACVPVSEKKIGLDDDPNQYLWFGWLDGKQADAPYGQIVLQKIRGGHKIEDAWLCPPRSQW